MRTAFQSKRRALIHASVVSLLMYGCASSAGPSEAAAREVFEAKMHDGLSKGTIRIKSFQKTSGPINVGDTYVVAFRAEFECLKDYSGFYCGTVCKQGTMVHVEEGSGWIKIAYGIGNEPAALTQKGTNLTTGGAFTRTYDGSGRLASFDEQNKWAGLKFNKTWRGWEGYNGKVY